MLLSTKSSIGMPGTLMVHTWCYYHTRPRSAVILPPPLPPPPLFPCLLLLLLLPDARRFPLSLFSSFAPLCSASALVAFCIVCGKTIKPGLTAEYNKRRTRD